MRSVGQEYIVAASRRGSGMLYIPASAVGNVSHGMIWLNVSLVSLTSERMQYGPSMTHVKGRTGTRRDRAQATRRRIVDRAHELFSELDYAGTTMEAIADAAGVAPQTVYYVFGTKARLLR